MKRSSVAAAISVSVATSISIAGSGPGAAQSGSQSLPAVKVSSANKTPECATPGRMMALIGERNPKLDPRYADIATAYMRHGEELGVRWDYGFFQMILETGSLAYKRGDGKPGDVKPSQNNFAGLGATGNREPGEKFASIDDGVKAHLQHLLMYTGEQVAEPVAERTRNVQQWGILTSWQKGFKRPITFADVAGKWAPGSRGYVSDMKSIAADFYDDHCSKADPKPQMVQEARASSAKPTKTARVAKEAQPSPDFARQAMERAREEGDGTRSSLGAKGVIGAKPASSGAQSTEVASAAGGAAFKIINEQTPEAPGSAPAAEKPVQVAAAAVAGAKPPTTKGSTQSAGASAASATPPATTTAAPLATTVAALPKAPATGATATAPPAAASSAKCRVFTASYGGQKAVIIRASGDSFTNFTVLDVNEGQENREVEAYISAYAKGGQKVAAFGSSNAALEEAFKLCPEG